MAKAKYRDYRVLGIERETDPDTLQLLEEGERGDRALGAREVRVNIRWDSDQVDLIKKVASSLAVPYQGYIKQVVMRQALADLRGVGAPADETRLREQALLLDAYKAALSDTSPSAEGLRRVLQQRIEHKIGVPA
ncbi:MAG: hypothetical protein ACYDAG_05725 [Chloroflexota bacterium]